MRYSPTLSVMINVVQHASKGLKRDFGELENLQTHEHTQQRFVVTGYQRLEQRLKDELHKVRPGYSMQFVDQEELVGSDRSHRWYIVPCDGLTNFMHGVPFFAISLALERDQVLQACVIYNPINDALYVAEKGRGAFFNDRRLRVNTRRINRNFLAVYERYEGSTITTLQSKTELSESQADLEILNQIRRVQLRSFGALTLSSAFVASGLLDVWIAQNTTPAHLASSVLLLKESGAIVRSLDNKTDLLTSRNVIGGSSGVVERLNLQEKVKRTSYVS